MYIVEHIVESKVMAFGSSYVGHPHLQVDVEEVAEMRKIVLSITKISEMIGFSRSTLYRALEGTVEPRLSEHLCATSM